MSGDDPIVQSIRKRINRHRDKRQMSLSLSASELGAGYRQLREFEMPVNRVSAATLHRLGSILGVHTDAFFTQLPSAEVSIVATGEPEALNSEVESVLARIGDAHVQAAMRQLLLALEAYRSSADPAPSSPGLANG